MRDRTLALTLLMFLVGCSRAIDPCPEGSSLHSDRCVPDDTGVDRGPVQPEDAASSDAEVLDAEKPDASAWVDGDIQQIDAEPRIDAEPDAEPDDATIDARPNANENLDAAPDATAPTACNGDTLARWQDFHLSAQLVSTIGDCVTVDPRCVGSHCPIDGCLRETLGIEGCSDCIAQQVACVTAACTQACGPQGSNETCRACACLHGCVDVFDACSEGVLDVCADCDDTTCVNASVLPPALLMVVLNQMLLGS